MKKDTSSYFKKVKEGDEVFGLVFGHGIVLNVYDGYYTFEVEYDNGHVVPYTSEGVPAWSNFEYQTVFYKSDINVLELDFKTNDKVLSPKKIIKLREKNKLEVKCPSGIWNDYYKCPSYITEEYLEEEKFFLFRKKNN